MTDRGAARVRADGRVTLEHVSFRYQPAQPLIEDFSLDAQPGQTIAIVGPTGAGKITIVNLMMRFYEIDAGRILLDGIDYRDLTREGVRRCAHADLLARDGLYAELYRSQRAAVPAAVG